MNKEITLYKFQKEEDDEHSTFVKNENNNLYRFYCDGWDGYRGNTTCKEISDMFKFLGYEVNVIDIDKMPENYENKNEFIFD